MDMDEWLVLVLVGDWNVAWVALRVRVETVNSIPGIIDVSIGPFFYHFHIGQISTCKPHSMCICVVTYISPPLPVIPHITTHLGLLGR